MKDSIRKMVKMITTLTLVEIAISSILKKGTLGIVIGSIGSILNLYSLWYDTNRMVKNGFRIWKTGYVGRYVFNAVLMLIGGLISLADLMGVFVGLMNLKLSAYIVLWRERG